MIFGFAPDSVRNLTRRMLACSIVRITAQTVTQSSTWCCFKKVTTRHCLCLSYFRCFVAPNFADSTSFAKEASLVAGLAAFWPGADWPGRRPPRLSGSPE